MSDDLRDRLAEALNMALLDYHAGKTTPDVDLFGYYADALLPLIQADRKRAKAEALEEAAEDWWKPGRPHRPVRDWLRARAASLRDPETP